MPNCASRGTKVCKERLPMWTCKIKPENKNNYNMGYALTIPITVQNHPSEIQIELMSFCN